MSSYRQLCNPQSCVPCNVTCPQPFVDACNQPCVTSCGDSSAVVYPPPIVVNFPGPILATCPQESVVGSSAPYGIRSALGLGGSSGSRSLCNYGGSYALGLSARGSGCVYPSASQQFTTYRHGSCRLYQTQK